VVDVSPEVKLAQENTAKLLEGLGHTVVEGSWPVNAEEFASAYTAFFRGRALPLKKAVEAMSGVPVSEAGLLTNFFSTFSEFAATIEPEKAKQAEKFLDTFPTLFEKSFKQFDMLLAPVCPVIGPKLSDFSPDDAFDIGTFTETLGQLKFTGPINFAGNPAMSVPLNWGADSGMPIGSHFIAALGADKMLYEMAYELEEARPWKDKWLHIR